MRARQRTAELTNFQFSLLLALPVLVFLILVVAYPLGYALWMSLHEISFTAYAHGSGSINML